VHTGFRLKNPKEIDHVECTDAGTDERMILKRTLNECDGIVWALLTWLRCIVVDGSCEHGDEYSGSLKCGSIATTR
jgi:hypothetical protein